jgi:hypothetical protein
MSVLFVVIQTPRISWKDFGAIASGAAGTIMFCAITELGLPDSNIVINNDRTSKERYLSARCQALGIKRNFMGVNDEVQKFLLALATINNASLLI